MICDKNVWQTLSSPRFLSYQKGEKPGREDTLSDACVFIGTDKLL